MSGSESFAVRASDCAVLFRLGRDVEAGLVMIDLVTDIQPSFDKASQQGQQEWLQVLAQMLQCQETQNWLALADYLEYELIQVLADNLSV
ncbi:hypothetical protein [Pseudomonas sp. HMWF006]|uniref:hypothetical protein n=1 Tax=Pseudomonas sp. HMWF006 TaxID=2056843 RepID=UPI000D435948|nr:hypothetical protein [Pseudomonas sp. HMWF006]PTS97969.1 hypothetical protein DBR24_15475 [Pseudomonas sp. HMWF006]PTT72694.1 hypothetical protein DBR26_04600 [Pseudomonas sp. HMWF007]PTT94724.1 hypothetical protein DBR29_02575 [Pseudomonas sp. HMWF005]